MKKLLTVTLLLVSLVGTTAARPQQSEVEEPFTIGLELVADGLTSPVTLVEPPDGTGRIFIVDQDGEIWILTADGDLLSEPFLDLSDELVDLNPNYDERGLLGLALHPDYTSNGRFFVYYSIPLGENAPDNFDHTNVLAEYSVSEDDPNQADSGSEIILLEEDWPYSNHNGGTLAFGPDGMLYLSWGDGGNRDDEGIGHVEDWYEANTGGNGQDIEQNPKGSLMRMDVSTPGTIVVPEDNPFVGQLGSDVLEMQWAYGFRNPYRFSFDMGGNHDLLVGDAGQEVWEEVSLVTEGGNYGWNVKEGTHCFDAENPEDSPADCPDTVGEGHPDAGAPLIDPVIEFLNANQSGGLGLVVVGGHVYRGGDVPQLRGRYLFGVWSKGEQEIDGEQHFPGAIFVTKPGEQQGLWNFQRARVWNMPEHEFQHFLLGFGQDLEGEVYVLATDEVGPTGDTGKVYKLASPGQVYAPLVLHAD